MGVYFRTRDGGQGMLDVALMLRQEGLIPFKVEHGNVIATTQDGTGEAMFSVAQWAEENDYTVDKIDGFNTPVTALNIPPKNMTSLDQSVWYMSGGDPAPLREVFSQVETLDDGRTVVLDSDGLWKTMWSDTWEPEKEYTNYADRVDQGLAPDTRPAMRAAGIAFLFGLSGVDPKITKTGDISPESVGKMLRTLNANAPLETQMQLAKLSEQTTGVDQWKFMHSLAYWEDTAYWLKNISTKTSMDFRMIQADHAEMLVAALHKLAMKDFADSMQALMKTDMAKSAVINMKEAAMEFLAMLHGMDVIRDLSRVTGLEEWKMQAEQLVDERKLPPMPSFVPRLVKLLQYTLPIAKDKALMMAKGKRGLKAVTSIMMLIDACLYSLSDVPESTAKSKMFMVLKTFQTKLEGKLAMTFHPIDNDKGDKANPFMQAKQVYGEKRETIYRLVQSPKESWSQIVLQTLHKEPNFEAFYEMLPPIMAKIIQSFVCMDTAYDMQPWIDSNYQERLLDEFTVYQDLYGPPPPEFGVLANNSPRAALNIIDTLGQGAGMLMAMDSTKRREILRRPIMFMQLMRVVQTAAVGREVGATEILAKMGLQDPYASPSRTDIWRDPNEVQQEQDALMAQLQDYVNQQMAAAEQQNLAQDQQMAQSQGSSAMGPGGGDASQAPMMPEPGTEPGSGKLPPASKGSPMSGSANGSQDAQMAAGG